MELDDDDKWQVNSFVRLFVEVIDEAARWVEH